MTYLDNTKKAMEWLAKKNKTFFLGQTVEYPGSPMYNSLKDIPINKKLELPIFEDTQLGMSIGLAIDGYIPISIFPRMDFLICAINQLVNHLDKMKEMSSGEFKPGVIIRTQIGATAPLDPGMQHKGDYTSGLYNLTNNIIICVLNESKEILTSYKQAYRNAKSGISTILIELPQSMDKKTWEKIQNVK